jgi:hypothetical protein
MSQTDRNNRYRANKGLVTLSLLVAPRTKELFADIRQRDNITAAKLFDRMIGAYQKQSVTILQPDQSEPDTAPILQGDHATADNAGHAINLDMQRTDRNAFALGLLESHGGNKRDAMAELKTKLQEQYPGFSVDRNKKRTGTLEAPMKFYAGVSDFLVRYLKA